MGTVMKWTGLNELREKFLTFFEGKSHTKLDSFPLIPKDDKSLLLINSGMAPLKPYFLGQRKPPNKRMVTCQKCIRTPDIDRVGLTSRHGTFFEMLGNFSFGDYFKKEATAWAWEFFTKTLEIPIELLWVSIYLEDDEAFDIWTKEVGVQSERIVRLGKEDNFWEHGPGPCGPCSEIYFDRGAKNGCGSQDCKVGCDCDRYVEIWNLVFTQFKSDGEGNYTKLENPNIDTGMGLERLACVMQNVNSLFEVDTIKNIMDAVSKTANIKYKDNAKNDISMRVITDHIRSTVFMVCDGVSPSNEGRGYVLRRLLRRAARHGKILGIDKAFLFDIAEVVINENKEAYPELLKKRDYIIKLITAEEENFRRTLNKGLEILTTMIDKFDNQTMKTISGEQAFKLYDTFGFPFELIKEMISEHNINVDEHGFLEHMKQQRQRAREAREQAGDVSWDDIFDLSGVKLTEFVGYDEFVCDATLLVLNQDGENKDSLAAGEEGIFIFDKTPFYAVSGGQAADKGKFITESAIIDIKDVNQLPSGHYAHYGIIEKGTVHSNTTGKLELNINQRIAAMRNHTAAHLLQKALQEVLGEHVHQAGQLVDDNRVRFDFHHLSAVEPEQLKLIEDKVNRAILSALPVNVVETDFESAQKMGALALFSEKYGDKVRVVDINGYSIELCGGTHVGNTSQLGLFAILNESSISAGVRRIEGVTGTGVLGLLYSYNSIISETCNNLKVQNKNELPAKSAQLAAEMKKLESEIKQLNSKNASLQLEAFSMDTQEVKGCQVIRAFVQDADAAALRIIGDRLRDKNPLAIAVIGSERDGKGSLLAVCGKEAVKKGAHAGKIVNEIAILAGGKGGGRPDSAMAGVKEPEKIEKALSELEKIVENNMGE